jgi:hypothetical protein
MDEMLESAELNAEWSPPFSHCEKTSALCLCFMSDETPVDVTSSPWDGCPEWGSSLLSQLHHSVGTSGIILGNCPAAGGRDRLLWLRLWRSLCASPEQRPVLPAET